MKGQNQTLAVSLLILVTIAGTATLGAQYTNIIDAQSEKEVVDLEVGKLSMETCWEETNDAGDTVSKMAMRNGQDVELNTSRITTVVNASTVDAWYSEDVVNPQDTFVINTTQDLSPEAQVNIVAGNGKEESFSCPDFS